MARERRDNRAVLALVLIGAPILIGSTFGAIAWAGESHGSKDSLAMLAPALGGLGLLVSGIVLSTAGAGPEDRRAIDAFNDAAAREGRCPPTASVKESMKWLRQPER
jgi:hypothetical protein